MHPSLIKWCHPEQLNAFRTSLDLHLHRVHIRVHFVIVVIARMHVCEIGS